MDTTTKFVEAKGRKPFDWWQFLTKEKYTLGDIIKAYRLSQQWVTCACGNQCDIIPRRVSLDDSPFDTELFSLGIEFTDYMGKFHHAACHQSLGLNNSDFKTELGNLRSILISIEKRSQEIINEIKIQQDA